MRIYAQKYRQSPQEPTAYLMRSRTAAPVPAARPLKLAHDFGRIPVHAPLPATIQAKLTINQPGDRYEQEAERVADRVMRQSDSSHKHACDCGGTCAKCKTGDLDQEHIQTRLAQDRLSGETAAPPLVQEVVSSPGQPLDISTRNFMQARFGHDFSRVRVHTDAKASDSARQINALAYTSGTNIVLARGQYHPSTAAGRRLLAHELTHVIQQTGGGMAAGASRSIQRQPAPAGGEMQLPPLGTTDLREGASPLLASALGSTTVDGFALGKADIPKAGEDSLRYAAKQILFFIRKYPASTVQIAGHTDRVGTDERNVTLGKDRAEAVSAFLQGEGVPADIISTESKGESEPVVPTKNDQAEPRNRRVNVFFRVVQSPISFGGDYSLKPPSFEKVPPITIIKPKIDIDITKPRIPFRDPAETDLWKRMEENQRKIEEYDRTHPRENKSLGEAVIDTVMKEVVKPILKKLPLPDNLREKAEGAIRDGLESGSEKACEAAIDQLSVGSAEKEALKAACKAALKQKPGGSKP